MPTITVSRPPKYPLTKSEKEWLERRRHNLSMFGGYFCPSCPWIVIDDLMYCGRGGETQCVVDTPHALMYKEAAEFEARVYEKAAEHCWCLPEWYDCNRYRSNPEDQDECTPHEKYGLDCTWCRRKAYTLEVEEELNDFI